ncbi:hypothetical protein BH10PAT1_BH10PAT1_3830 [soil metagenome]
MEIKELILLGFTEEEATSLNHTQSYEPPTDPEKLFLHAKSWSIYETGVRGLNSDLADGKISQEEYFIKENELYNEAQNREL